MKWRFFSIKITILFLLIAFTFVNEPRASVISYENISLEEIINLSIVIVTTKKNDPSISQEEVVITFERNCQPYTPIKTTYHFKITQVLYSDGLIKEGQNINVLPANWEREINITKRCCNDEDCISPIYRSYSPNADFTNLNELILFLKTTDYENFTFSAENSYESISKKEEIQNSIKRIKQNK